MVYIQITEGKKEEAKSIVKKHGGEFSSINLSGYEIFRASFNTDYGVKNCCVELKNKGFRVDRL